MTPTNPEPLEDCARCQDLLNSVVLQRDLTPSEEAEVERHLASCPDCGALYLGNDATDDLVAGLLEQAAPGDVLALLSPEAVAVIRDLPADDVTNSRHMDLLAALQSTARQQAAPIPLYPIAAFPAPQSATPITRIPLPIPAPAALTAPQYPKPSLASVNQPITRRGWRLKMPGVAAAALVAASLPVSLAIWLRTRLEEGVLEANSPVPTSSLAATTRSRHRRWLHFMLNRFDMIEGVLVILIILLTVLPVAASRPIYLLWVTCAALYMVVKSQVTRSPMLRLWLAFQLMKPLHRKIQLFAKAGRLPHQFRDRDEDDIYRAAHFCLAIGLLVCATVFAIAVRSTDHQLGIPTPDASATWLFFSLPILWLTRYSSMVWILVMTCLAVSCNGLVHRFTDLQWGLDSVRLLTIQSFWIMLICMLPAILSRYIGEVGANLNATVDVINEIARIHPTSLVEFANIAAAIIGRRMDYEQVFVMLSFDKSAATKVLRVAGAASDNGRRLVAEGYEVAYGQGVTGRCLANRREQLVNNVHDVPDGCYLEHKFFLDTQAELAMPILVGNECLGVLDLQSTTRYDFSEDDVELLRAVVTHLGVHLLRFKWQPLVAPERNAGPMTWLAPITDGPSPMWQHELPNTSQPLDLVRPLLRHDEVRPMLEEIVRMVREVMAADVVVLYPRNPWNGVILEPIWAGDLHTLIGSPASLLAHSAVNLVLETGDPQFESDARRNARLMAWGHKRVHEQEPFVIREDIQSAAALPLRVAVDEDADQHPSETLGVIFINYRTKRLFPPSHQRVYLAVTHLAALVLHNMMRLQTRRCTPAECASTWRDLYEDIAHFKRHARGTGLIPTIQRSANTARERA